MDDRIAELERQLSEAKAENKRQSAAAKAENAKFEARLRALESPKRAPPRQEPPIEGTQVFYPPAQTSFIMPSPKELLQLLDVTLAAYPKHGQFSGRDADEKERALPRSFSSAFHALGALKRLDAPDTKHYASHWREECEILLRGWGDHTDIGLGFFLAMVAQNDIPFSDTNIPGVVLELGLSLHNGCPAGDAWRRTLAGCLPEPVRPVRSRNYQTPQFSVRVS